MYCDDELIPINLLQHYAFCPRQCGLIAIENLWQDNVLTIGGSLLHESVDSPETESIGDCERITALRIHSYRYGLTGKCDVVELRHTAHGLQCLPVEFKAGQPKHNDIDCIQLCAQALCLEEMLACRIEHGAFFYGKVRRRVTVHLDERLRQQTTEMIAAVRQLVESMTVPPAEFAPKCNNCSLISLCQPKASNAARVRRYIHDLFHPSDDVQ